MTDDNELLPKNPETDPDDASDSTLVTSAERFHEEEVSGDLTVDAQPNPFKSNYKGRKPGTKNLRTRAASRRLKELGFDPMEELIRTYDETAYLIQVELRKEKPNKLYVAQLQAIKSNTSKELMRYGYARETETVDVKTDTPAFLQVALTDGSSHIIGTVPTKPTKEDDDEED